ncbi:MAG: hypothetical protein WD468_06110 [Pirellulales bacterium]
MSRDFPRIHVIDEETAAKFRSMTAAEKIRMAGDLIVAARKRAADRLKIEHSDWDDQKVLAEVARLLLCGNESYFA